MCLEIADGREREVGQRPVGLSGRKEQQTPVLEASVYENLGGQEVTWKGGRKERSAGRKDQQGLDQVEP